MRLFERRSPFRAIFCLFVLFLSGPAVSGMGQEVPKSDISPKSFAGDWLGTLDLGRLRVRLVLHIMVNPDGKTLSGTFDSPDQGATGLKLDSVTSNGGTFAFEFKPASISYSGTLAADGGKISGNFMQGNARPLEFARVTSPLAIGRPQDPKKPYPYKEEDVTFDNPAAAGVRLAGTLTLPADAKGPVPAVILITGSGPQNRDEFLLGHRPFLVLADHLTRSGFAVLRYDDRGVARSTGNFVAATSADFATDTEAAIAFLKTRKEVDPTRIGLVGHSEGGLIAPMVAARSKDVAFIVLMAGPGIRGDEVLLAQSALIAKAEGRSAERIARGQKVLKKFFEILLAESDLTVAEKKMKEAVAAVLAEVPDPKERESRATDYADTIRTLNSVWFRYFLVHEPRADLEKLKIPVLAINGTLDLQVPYKDNLSAIEKALTAAGNKNFRTVELANLNHLFQTAKTGAVSEYGGIEETIAPVALETMSEWLKVQAGLTKGGK